MIKRYHEAPISVFKDVQQMTDGDYALVHLFETNKTYFNLFKEAVAQGRDVILDNSIFELGKAFDGDKYAYWIKELQPTWYIIPDSWKNGEETCKMYFDFISKYPDLPGKRIAVAQGKTIEEVEQSYNELKDFCDMIAFNLDFSSVYYDRMPEHIKKEVPYCVAMSYGRYDVLTQLDRKGVIDHSKPHHLLGCGVPQEVQWYPSGATWIRSIDTSNPVINGLCGNYYGPRGISIKPSTKVCDIVNMETNVYQLTAIRHNITLMKSWCNKWEGAHGTNN